MISYVNNRIMKISCLLVVLFILMVVQPARSFEFYGFGDVTYTKADEDNNDKDSSKNGQFALGQLDLYTTLEIDDRIDILVEIVLESPGGEWGIDGERIEVGYLFSDALQVRVGRFHNLIGYWNTSYHHGAHLQTTIGRPDFLEFEDEAGILPAHIVGLWARGRKKLEPIVLNYGLMLGNGSQLKGKIGEAALDPNNTTDNNTNKSFSFNLTIEPAAYSGAGIGLFGNLSRVARLAVKDDPKETKTEGTIATEVDQTILGADIFYKRNGAEFIAEYYNIKDKDKLGSDDFTNNAYYIQGGYRLIEKFTPYLRYENFSDKDNDPYMIALGRKDSIRWIGGIKYDIMYRSAIKAEYRSIDDEDKKKVNEYAVQWTFAF
ncbi:MAG: outer membrane protein [Nitrospirota bacterium]